MKFHTKASPGLVALGAGAVIAVYTAGLVKTRAAAARFEEPPAMRRPAPNPPAIVPVTPPIATAPVRAEARQPMSAPAVSPRASAKPSVPPPVASGTPATTAPVSTQPSPETPKATKTPDTPTPPASAPPVVPADATMAAAPVTDAASKLADPPAPPKSLYKDGTYSGWGTSRHGEIQATVVIENGRITSAVISDCETRYPCSFIAHLPPQVVVRQSADVDYVTGATQSADAFYYAVLQALSKAR